VRLLKSPVCADTWVVPDEALQRQIAHVDRELERLVDDSRTRMLRRLDPRDRVVSIAMGTALLAVAVTMAAAVPWGRSPTALEAILLVLTLTVFSRIQFEVGAGVALPTQLALVPMLFILPAATVPLAAAAGYLLGGFVDCVRGRLHPERLFVILGSSWHAVGPALVFLAAGEPSPTASDWPLYALALCAQFAFDAASALVRDSLALGVSPRLILPCLAWVYAVDAALFPAGLMAALAAEQAPYAFLLIFPFAGLLAMFDRERRGRIDRVLELAGAYRVANEEARRDALTGLGNRLAWEEAVAAAERRRQADAAPVSIVVVDMDGLKAANDAHGHEVGDGLLRKLAAVLQASVRDADIVCRIGGDEFAILLPNAAEDDCAEVVERLRAAIVESELSAAIGTASVPPAGSIAEAHRTADSGLYKEKSLQTLARSA
jgi:diguanylate cyclase (GGDEF)-like protein